MPKLTFDAFFKALRKGEVPNALYLHGAEDVLKEEAVAEILSRTLEPSLKDFNFDQRSAADLDPEQAETLCHVSLAGITLLAANGSTTATATSNRIGC